MRQDEPFRLREAVVASVLPWTWFLVRDWSPLFDAAAILLPPVLTGVVAALAIVARVYHSRLALAAAVSWVLVAAVAVVGPWLPTTGGPAPDPAIRVIATNLRGGNPEAARALAELVAANPDVLVISELTRDLWRPLRDVYADFEVSPAPQDLGVFSRWPLTSDAPLPAALAPYGVRVRVEAPHGRFVVYALHLPRPWPDTRPLTNVSLGAHRELIEALRDAVAAEALPVVVAGDLNLSDRTSGYRALTADLRDAMRTTWTGPTSQRWRGLVLRIDHIFISEAWCASDAARFEVPGSDHLALSVLVGECA